jgi:DNA adenine methylase
MNPKTRNMYSTYETGPFLKWLGGKRWLTDLIKKNTKDLEIKRYIEPFVGGGAVFFSLLIRPAIISDINKDLINTYVQVKKNPDKLLTALKQMEISSQYYYEIRNKKPKNNLEKAVRLIYLNRTAFSGMYRVNNNGDFNVPFGNYSNSLEILWRDRLIEKASEALQDTEILCTDFETILNQANNGDLVYCDPTYTTMHNNNGFRKYNERCFSWKDQQRLAMACQNAASRGVMIIVSNAFHKEILDLYENFDTQIVERTSVLCPNSLKRKLVQEYLFFSLKK